MSSQKIVLQCAALRVFNVLKLDAMRVAACVAACCSVVLCANEFAKELKCACGK